tara:strand:+ start:5129 stop:6211 length:1083 start_codon:yes stop_codon:yes gene_type:complete
MITIIGAGPSGSYLGYLLAKAGKEVTIIEEHSEVGSPVQCTGIMTPSIENYVELKKDVVANKLKRVVANSKNKKVDVKLEEYVVWRNLFDKQISDMAVDAGVKLLTSHKFIDIEGKHCVVVKESGKLKKIISTHIVGADGPSSMVARKAGIKREVKNYIGMQAKVKLKMEMGSFETYFGSGFPNFFGWVVPESEDTVRLGLGALSNAKDYFYKFLEDRTGKKDVVSWESGLIPLYNPGQVIQKDNVYLIGDAATQVKATTGGGIVPSFKAAHVLSDCILREKNYNVKYKVGKGNELLAHFYMRRMLNKYSDKDYDKLVEMMGQERIKNVLNKYDRDTPIPLCLNLLFREPRFVSMFRSVF